MTKEMPSSRKYTRTHPWIKFVFSTQRFEAPLWLLLGEAQSKCQHLAGVPLRPNIARELHMIYLAKGVHATTAIEGNTLTERDVMLQMEGKLDIPPSKEYLAQETKNIEDAYNQIVEQALEGNLPPLNAETIKVYNALVLKDLPVEDHVVPGEYTKVQVGVGQYRGAPPEDISFLMEKFSNWITGPDFIDQTGKYPIVHGLIRAILAHLYMAWIHPFGDGNGRTARLVELRILLEASMPTPAIHLLSDHYNKTRMEYYRRLQRASSRSDGDYVPFIEYAVQGFVDSIKEQIELIKNQQIDVSWRNYVHEFIREHEGASSKRMRHLLLDLSRQDKPVSLESLRFLTPKVTQEYSKLALRTLTRDLKWLSDNELIRKTEQGYMANKELILAFLPRKAAQS